MKSCFECTNCVEVGEESDRFEFPISCRFAQGAILQEKTVHERGLTPEFAALICESYTTEQVGNASAVSATAKKSVEETVTSMAEAPLPQLTGEYRVVLTTAEKNIEQIITGKYVDELFPLLAPIFQHDYTTVQITRDNYALRVEKVL